MQVEIKAGYTLGLLPDATLNDTVLDATKGFAHTFSSRGTFVNGSNSLSGAVNNTHNAAYSFTYVLASGTCGTATEPFNTAGCTAARRIQCKSPTTLASVICDTDATDPKYVALGINSQGQYAIWRTRDGAVEYLATWTEVPGLATGPGVTHRLTAACQAMPSASLAWSTSSQTTTSLLPAAM